MPSAGEVRIAIACDQVITRAAFASLIGQEAGLAVIGEASDGETAVEQVLSLSPDVFLAVVPLAHLSAFDLLRRLKKDPPLATRTILVAEDMGPFEIFEALDLGARGIMTKQIGPTSLLRGIHRVAIGDFWINRDTLVEWIRSRSQKHHRYHVTERERQILDAVMAGAANREIASACEITQATARRHLANLYRKLGVSGRLELVIYAVSHQL